MIKYKKLKYIISHCTTHRAYPTKIYIGDDLIKKLKTGSYIVLAIGTVSLILSLLIPYIRIKTQVVNNGSFAIIGGADIPTAYYLFSELLYNLIFSLTLIIAALFCIIFKKTVIEHCSAKTTVLSLLTSLTTAAGYICVIIWYSTVAFGFGGISTYPIAYPLSIISGLLCLAIFIVLIILYVKSRKTNFSAKGLIIDILTCI